jgi:signal transduction histidine kinase
VTLALAVCGWALALACAWRMLALGRRLELVACAEHELRGPLAALALAAARSRPVPALVVEGQLERACVALADLAEARHGRRAAARPERHDLASVAARAAAAWDVRFEWHAGRASVDADPGRISQALGNLLSNALEHGGGCAVVRGIRRGKHVRIEVEDRGRGLGIAERALEHAGGRIALSLGPEGTVAALELPLAEG